MRLLNLIAEHTREWLLVRVGRRWSSVRVISALAEVMVLKGCQNPLLKQWVGVRRQRPTERLAKQDQRLYTSNTFAVGNGYRESFKSKLRDEFLSGEIFYSMKGLRVLAESLARPLQYRQPHSSRGYRPPAPEDWPTNKWGLKKWKPLRASHFSTPTDDD